MTAAAFAKPRIGRLTGLTSLGELPWGSHVCHFYRTAADLAGTLVPFFRAGLEQNERCLWITSEPLPAAQARAALRAVLPELERYEKSGQLEILDHDDWYTRGGQLGPDETVHAWLERESAALRDGYTGLRLSGNTFWLERSDWDAFIHYECQVHAAFHGRRILALCSYCLERCSANDLLEVLDKHGAALVSDGAHCSSLHSATELLAGMSAPCAAPHERPSESRKGHLSLVAPPVVQHGHDVWFYDEGQYPAPELAAYLAEALKHGGGALGIAAEQHLPALREALASQGVDVATAAQRKQLVLLPAEEVLTTFSDDTGLQRRRFDAIVGGHLRHLRSFGEVRVFGEIVDLLCRDGRQHEAVLLEGWWNALLEREPASLLCAYRLQGFADAGATEAFSDVCAQHAEVRAQAASELDAGRLAASLAQRTRALERELQRNQSLRGERKQLVAAETRARFHANAAAHHLAQLQAVTAALSEAVSVRDACAVLHTQMLQAVGAVGGAVALPNEQDQLVVMGPSCAAFALCAAAYLGGPVCAARSQDELKPQRWVPGRQPVVAVALPLQVRNKSIGALVFEFPRPNVLSAEISALLWDFARQLALALDRAQLYERAEYARTSAEEANRAKDGFLAMLGHELRNPLAPILTALELMGRRNPDLAVRERAIMHRQLQHVVRLLDDLLDVSRIRRGSFQLSRSLVDLAEVVSLGVELAMPLLEARHHRLELALPDTALLVDVDPYRFAQVLANLLTNAAKFTPSGEAIELRVSASESGRACIEVRDSGRGIEPALLPHVFELFVQQPQSLDRADGGLGLGLWIARTLVELHGGTIRAESAGTGLGSTFTVELPLSAAGDAGAP